MVPLKVWLRQFPAARRKSASVIHKRGSSMLNSRREMESFWEFTVGKTSSQHFFEKTAESGLESRNATAPGIGTETIASH
jgi:hypothetical protein